MIAALIALGVCAPAAIAKSKFRPRVGTAMGLMPALGQQEIATGTGIPVVFHGGLVMRGVTIHTVFWAPSGYRFNGSPSAGVPGYQALIEQFFTDAAHDSSATASNIFSTLGEYPDGGGGGLYNFSYSAAADSIDVTDPYPTAGHQCVSPAGVATCVTDLQLQQELDRVVQARDPAGRGLHDLWFVFLPPDVDTCISPAVCGTNAFAGYHSLFNLGRGGTVYANIPDILIEGTPGPGQDPQGNPEAENGINTVAHEAVEAVTDPEGTAWMDPNGFEVADKCENPEYGTPLGYGTNGSPYNQLINGNKYLIQLMWSNVAMGCKQSSSSTRSALPLATVNFTQFSPLVSGNIGTPKRGVPAVVLVARAGTVIAAGGGLTNSAGSWGPSALHAVKGGGLHALGDDRDEILVRYGAGGPKPDLVETGNGGNPFTETGWTGWFSLDHGYDVRSNSVLVGPCSQTGVLGVFVDGAATASPVEQCETETDFAALQTKSLRGATLLRMSSSDNRAVTVDNPPGALIKLTIPLGEPRSVSSLGNSQVLFSPSGFPSCTADLRAQAVRCSGLVAGASYALASKRGHATTRARANRSGVARFSGFPGIGVAGGDVLSLRNAAGRILTSLHVAHLRVDLSGVETAITAGQCQPGDYYGPPLTTPPTSLAIGVPGTGGTGTICPLSGKAKGLSTKLISQVDDQSGGQTRTEVPQLEGTSPVQDANLYGKFVALAQTGLPGPNGSTIGSGARVALTITPVGSRQVVFRAANVDTARGAPVQGLAPGSYSAKWVVIDANGDTRTVQTRFVQVS